MAFGSKTAIGIVLCAVLPLGAWAQFQYDVEQERRPQRARHGKLTLDERGVLFEETQRKKKHKPFVLKLAYGDIEQLIVAKDSLTVVSYADSKWKLGADRQFRFVKPKGASFEPLHEYLSIRLDQRLVAAIAPAERRDVEWRLPAKHLRGAFGSQGVLEFGEGWIGFVTPDKERSRMWRYADIENVSSAGPYELTITTFERSRIHYNGYRDFSFQLKQRLEEPRYQQLWLRLQEGRQPNVLNLYKTKEK